jgi:preprotein translocase subunit SecD
MVAVRALRILAPLVVLAGALAGCGGGSSSSTASSADSSILGASSGFEMRTLYARYTPGVTGAPDLSKSVEQELSGQSCPMKPQIVGGMLMECDQGKTVYLLQNPIVRGDVADATAKQVGHKDIWYIEASLDSDAAKTISNETTSMTGEQVAFIYDGVVLSSIVIDSNFHPDHFAIIGDFDKASATKLAQELTA